METLATTDSASPDTEREFNLLLVRDRKDDWPRWRRAGIVSLSVHAVLIVVVLLMPVSMTTPVYESKPITLLTPLYIPTELTQKEPNKGKLSKELSVEAITPRPLLKTPSPPPPAKRVPASAPLPPPRVPKAEPKIVIAEPPKLQPEAPNPQLPDQIARLTAPALPPPNQQPKIVFENAMPPAAGTARGDPQAKIMMPDNTIEAVVRDLAKNPTPGTQSIGDTGADDNGTGLGINLPPSAGRPLTNMELKSDAKGVDFRPYMRQILFAIKQNWLAVYPEAARRGQRGETVLLFAIAKQGTVTKVSFSTESGAKALDEAAVAAISASNPLPPLPKGFSGDRIVLQLTFKYNMPK